jgi:hypothetical protein
MARFWIKKWPLPDVVRTKWPKFWERLYLTFQCSLLQSLTPRTLLNCCPRWPRTDLSLIRLVSDIQHK